MTKRTSLTLERKIYQKEIPILAYQSEINNKQRQLIFIHGLNEGWDVWAETIEVFKNDFCVRAIEFPWSGKQEDYRWGFKLRAQEWIAAAVKDLELDACVFVAHSFGANALLEFFNQYGVSNHVAAILVSPFYKHKKDLFTWDLVKLYIKYHHELIKSSLLARYKGASIDSDVLDIMYEKAKETTSPIEWMHFLTLFFQTPDLNLPKLNIPMLILGGENDPVVDIKDLYKLSEQLPKSDIQIVEDCGHFLMFEHNELLNRSIGGFLENNN